MIKKNYWIYLLGFLVILFLPLFNLPPWLSPPAWGKTIIFRSITAILLTLYLIESLISKKLTIKPSKILWALGGLALVGILSVFFSSDILFSLWGNPYRSGGLINYLFYLIFAFLLFATLKKVDWLKVINLSLIVGIFVSLIAIFQQYNLFPKYFVKAVNQPWSTIGGSTFLATYLVILFFIALGLMIKSIKDLNRAWFFYLPTSLLYFFVIVLTISRAAYLGIFVGLVYFIFFWPKNKKSKISLALLILFAGLIFFALTDINEIKNRLSLDNFLNDPRGSVWLISAQAIADKPLLGWGPENFSIAFDRHYDPSLSELAPQTATPVPTEWYDRAHNVLLDLAVTSGVLMPIIYLILLAMMIKSLYGARKKYPQRALIYHSLIAAILGYFTANFFGFDVFSTHLLFAVLVALVMHITTYDQKERAVSLKTGYLKYPLAGVCLILLVLFLWFYNLVPFKINVEINKALAVGVPLEKSVQSLENVLTQKTIIDEYVRANYLDLLNIHILRDPGRTIILAPKGIELLTEATEIRPDYTRFWLLLGTYYNLMLDNYQNVYPDKIEIWTAGAEEAFRKAQKLSPKRQTIYLRWARTYAFIDEFEKADEKIEKCIEFNPDFGDCYWTKVLVSFKKQDLSEAKQNIALAQKNNYPVFTDEIALLELRNMYYYLPEYDQYIEDFCKINTSLYGVDKGNEDYIFQALACYVRLSDIDKAEGITNYVRENYANQVQYVQAVENIFSQVDDFCKENIALFNQNQNNLSYGLMTLSCHIHKKRIEEASNLINYLQNQTEDINYLKKVKALELQLESIKAQLKEELKAD